MVTAIEANFNRHLDEAKIKAMTGGEPITARFMRQNFFSFQPEFKLWFVANDRPRSAAPTPPSGGGSASFSSPSRFLPPNAIVTCPTSCGPNCPASWLGRFAAVANGNAKDWASPPPCTRLRRDGRRKWTT
jgi:hypothetical protein